MLVHGTGLGEVGKDGIKDFTKLRYLNLHCIGHYACIQD